jgi:hypothetical protein
MADSLITGSTLDQLKSFVPLALAFLADSGSDSTYTGVKRELKTWVERDPMDALVAAVIGGGYAYYLAEHDSNDSCNTPLDGILYASSALFGYDTALPTTETGRAVASLVKTFGPALASNAFEPGAAEKHAAEAAEHARAEEAAAVNRQILARLEDIVRLLEAKS